MTTAEKIIAELDVHSRTLSTEQLLSELQIAVERVTFASAERPVQTILYSDIEEMFAGQLSTPILLFVHWLADNALLAVLAGNTGRHFLNYCMKYYRSRQQVVFTAAIKLPDEIKSGLQQTLATIYPKDARILFEVDETIVAGFHIKDSMGVVDKTMRTAAAGLTRQKLNEVFNG